MIADSIILIAIAISLHYVIEEFKDMNEIECPPYCETDHEHIKKKEKKDD